MENWLKKNLKYVTIFFIFLFLIKNTQSCNRGMRISVLERNHIEVVDSLSNAIDSLDQEINLREYKIIEVKKEGSDRLAAALSQTSGESAGNIQSLLRQLERTKQNYDDAQQRIYNQQIIINEKEQEINKLQKEIDLFKNN